jgi:hypothetical protein
VIEDDELGATVVVGTLAGGDESGRRIRSALA